MNIRLSHRAAAWIFSLGMQSVFAQNTGQTLFEANCAPCHQNDGSGTVGLAPSLKGEHWMVLGNNPQYIPMVLLKGLAGRIVVNGQTFSGNMPAFANQLDDASLSAIAQYVRSFQANSQSTTSQEWLALRQSKWSPMQTLQLRASILSEK